MQHCRLRSRSCHLGCTVMTLAWQVSAVPHHSSLRQSITVYLGLANAAIFMDWVISMMPAVKWLVHLHVHLSGMASFSSMSLISCNAAPCMRLISHPGTSKRGSPPCIAFLKRVIRSSLDSRLSILSSTCISGGNLCDTSLRTC